MNDNDSRGLSYTAGFFMLIAFAIAGLVFASLLSAQIWEYMTGKSFALMEKGMNDPANSSVMKIIQAVTAVIGFLVPTLVTAALLHRRPVKLLGFSARGINLSQVVVVVFLIGASLAVATSFSYLTDNIPIPGSWKIRFDKMEQEYNDQVSAIISLKNSKDYILALVIMAFLPALCEETLFRGGLQNFLSRGTNNPWFSIIVVSILFSVAHFSFYGFLSRFFLGLVLGAIFHYSGKLWLSILAHFLNNALAITLLLYLYPARKTSTGSDETGCSQLLGYFGCAGGDWTVLYFQNYFCSTSGGMMRNILESKNGHPHYNNNNQLIFKGIKIFDAHGI